MYIYFYYTGQNKQCQPSEYNLSEKSNMIYSRGPLNIQRVTIGEKIFRQSKQKFARIMAISAKNFCNE